MRTPSVLSPSYFSSTFSSPHPLSSSRGRCLETGAVCRGTPAAQIGRPACVTGAVRRSRDAGVQHVSLRRRRAHTAAAASRRREGVPQRRRRLTSLSSFRTQRQAARRRKPSPSYVRMELGFSFMLRSGTSAHSETVAVSYDFIAVRSRSTQPPQVLALRFAPRPF